MAVKKQRDANLDLLRIISMLLIVFLHTIDHSGVLENAENCSAGIYFYVRFTYAMCMVCVNIYVMLSGYYLVNSKFRLHKLVTLWMETVFYAFGLRLVFLLTGQESFSIVSLVSCFAPFLTGRYWFLTIYVGLYLVSPFLNILIHAMDRVKHGLLNLCLFFLFSVWITIPPGFAGMNSGGGWGLAWFVVLYLAAAWLRLYYQPNGQSCKWLALFLLIPAVMAAGQCLCGEDILDGIVRDVIGKWFRYDSAPVYIMTMCLFVGFLNVRIKGNKISVVITRLAPLTLGVYLIHAHADVDPWMWRMLNLPEKMNGWFPLIQIASILGIFVICMAIESIRSATIGQLENAVWLRSATEKIGTYLSKKLEIS